MHALLFAIGCYYTRAREALLLFLLYEGKITVVVFRHTRREHDAAERKKGERARERERHKTRK